MAENNNNKPSQADIARIANSLDHSHQSQRSRKSAKKKKSNKPLFPETAAEWRDMFKAHGMPTQYVLYRRNDPKETKRARKKWGKYRKRFYAEVLHDSVAELRAAGVSERGIKEMKERGHSRSGYNVHHKLPLGGGGKNIRENLVIIKDKPFHQQIHRHLDLQIMDMKIGESRWVEIAMPKGNVFIPTPEALEHAKGTVRSKTKTERRNEIRAKKRAAEIKDRQKKNSYKNKFTPHI